MIEYSVQIIDKTPSVAILELTGKLDLESSEFLLDTIQGLIEEGHANFVLDCADLEYISSLGLGTLIRAKSRLKHKSGVVTLANVRGMIAEAIHLVHFDKVFHIFDSVEAAIESMPDQ